MITSRDIKARSKRQPFVPFRVVMSSGDRYDVPHPEMIWVGERDIHVGMPSEGDPTIYEDVVRISVLHVTALEDIPKKVRKNGKK